MMDWKKDIRINLLSYTSNITKVLSIAASKCRGIEPRVGEAYNKLMKSLVDNDEGSVLEHATINFEIFGISVVALLHLTRHRIASFTVESQRYVLRDGSYNLPFKDDAKYHDPNTESKIKYIINFLYKCYEELIDNFKWRKDHARYILPMCDTRDLVVTFNLRSLRNFFKQRLHEKAQYEIRYIAWEMLKIAYNLPGCQPIFQDYWDKYKELYNG